MSNLIAYTTSITGHRNHALVNTALLSSLIDLLGGKRKHFQVRLFKIVGLSNGKKELELTAWNEGCNVHCEDQECAQESLPPELLRAIKTQTMVVTVPDQAPILHRCWIPAIYNRMPFACIEIESNRAITQRQLITLGAIINLYTNYLSLLTYSQIDTLTQLLNRKTFDDNLHQILAAEESAKHVDKERRTDRPAQINNWLVVIDIDHFKRINDQFGHLFGDEVLILIADTMRKAFRRRDKLFRFGGEEFVVLLRHVSEKHAHLALERFRQAVRMRDFPQVGKVTISIGYTRFQALDNSADVLGRADEALYYAKHHGRDQVRNYEELIRAGHLTRHTLNTKADIF